MLAKVQIKSYRIPRKIIKRLYKINTKFTGGGY